MGTSTRRRAPLLGGEPRDSQTSYQALLNGILERTLLDLKLFGVQKSARARAEIERIQAWIESDDCGATYGGFTFLYVCEHLNLSPDDVRRFVHAMLPTARCA